MSDDLAGTVWVSKDKRDDGRTIEVLSFQRGVSVHYVSRAGRHCNARWDSFFRLYKPADKRP